MAWYRTRSASLRVFSGVPSGVNCASSVMRAVSSRAQRSSSPRTLGGNSCRASASLRSSSRTSATGAVSDASAPVFAAAEAFPFVMASAIAFTAMPPPPNSPPDRAPINPSYPSSLQSLGSPTALFAATPSRTSSAPSAPISNNRPPRVRATAPALGNSLPSPNVAMFWSGSETISPSPTLSAWDRYLW